MDLLAGEVDLGAEGDDNVDQKVEGVPLGRLRRNLPSQRGEEANEELGGEFHKRHRVRAHCTHVDRVLLHDALGARAREVVHEQRWTAQDQRVQRGVARREDRADLGRITPHQAVHLKLGPVPRPSRVRDARR
eukprot:scaffold2983_cov66-Phaeocystis_antarctica.AAC.1